MEGGIQEREFKFKLIGYTPILMHNPEQMRRAGGAQVKRIPPPEEEAAAGLYITDGKLYMKFIAFRNCMLGGSRGMKIGKETAYAFLSGTLLNIDLDDPCYLIDPETGEQLGKTDFVIDTRRAVVQKNGVQRSRPKIMKWATIVSFQADVSQVSRPEEYGELVLRCLNRGGQFRGVGDYRPEKGGPFGRFIAEPVANGAGVAGAKKGKK